MNRILSFVMLTIFALSSFSPAEAQIKPEEFQKMMDSYLSSDDNLEKVGAALEKYFRNKRDSQRRDAAQQEAKLLEDQFENPVKIEVGKSPIAGNKDAKITIIEFSDFQCPFCQRGAATMDDLLKEYPDQVRVVFKNLPLPFHPEAKPAARAALAANEQGKFWEYHDELFKVQSDLGEKTYLDVAKKLKLDMKKFKKDMKRADFDKQIEEEAALATKLGIRGTPGFFVNGVQVKGARPLPYFKNLVERWLEKL